MIKTVSILGLGLIGGSLAKALREKADIEKIIAYTKDKQDIEKALDDNVIDKGYNIIDNELLKSDLIIICTPVKVSMKILDEIKDKIDQNSIIADVGSTKGNITSFAKKLNIHNFIGAHPMAGSEKSGYSNSISHLFENAFFVISRDENTSVDKLKDFISLISSIDAIPILLKPEEHDFITAIISHLPHIAAACLVNTARNLERDDEALKTLAAGGFKDITRIASSSAEMWENICTLNKDNIIKVLDYYQKEIEHFKNTLDSKSSKKLFKYFQNAKEFRNSIEDHKSTISRYYDITVDIPDKPGSIALVAKLLSDANINIKNIFVPASRELQEGCLLVSFEDEKTRIHALSILNKNNIKAVKYYEK